MFYTDNLGNTISTGPVFVSCHVLHVMPDVCIVLMLHRPASTAAGQPSPIINGPGDAGDNGGGAASTVAQVTPAPVQGGGQVSQPRIETCRK